MSFYEEWVELDLNPILSFSSTSKIIYTNPEAQFLLNRVSTKELYELAVQYAPKNFGFETSYIDLKISNYTFYAITVFYNNEDEIHMKLYKSAMVKKENTFNIKNIDTTNIFTIVDLAINTFNIKEKNLSFIKNYDPSIPEFKLNSSILVKSLMHIFDDLKSSLSINVSIKLKIGEYIRIEGKKYSLVCLEISSNTQEDLRQKEFPDHDSFILSVDKSKVTIDLPLII